MICYAILQSHGQSEGFEKVMRNINIVFTTLFTIESILKILGFGIKVSSNISSGQMIFFSINFVETNARYYHVKQQQKIYLSYE